MDERKIKFRAWHKGQKYMFVPEALWFNRFNTKDIWLNNSHDYGPEENRNKLFGYVGKDIVLMQFTGLKDKKGVEIYEGDIVTADTEWNFGVAEIRGVIEYDEAEALFEVRGEIVNKQRVFPASHCSNFKIIATIYENPELLKGRTCEREI